METRKKIFNPGLHLKFLDACYWLTLRFWRYDFASDLSQATSTAARCTSVPVVQSVKVIAEVGKVNGMVFYDVGCGKGKVLFLAAAFPFEQVIGLELFPKLADIARENVRRKPGGQERIHIICEDALTHAYPARPAVYYFFNPFPKEIFDQAISRILACCGGSRVVVILVHIITDAYTSVLARHPFVLTHTLVIGGSTSHIYERVHAASA